MLILQKLYSEPATFSEIFFREGINLILGETNQTSEKTNGVGKSLCIEFLNFSLLKELSSSRLSLIPEAEFSRTIEVCLDFKIGEKSCTLRRSMAEHSTPSLTVNGISTKFQSLQDATQHMNSLVFGSASHVPSFRTLLGPLLRDERSEFKSIIDCFDTKLNIPSDYTPHLYLLGIAPEPYIKAKFLQAEIDGLAKARSKLRKDIETFTGRTLSDAKADLNDLSAQVSKIKSAIDQLEQAESFELVKDELIDLERRITEEQVRLSVDKQELSKINLFKGDNYIDENEVAELYSRFKLGLGDLIMRELKEVMKFKQSIDQFQATLLHARRDTLSERISASKKKLKILDARYKEKLQVVDHDGALKSLKTTIATYQSKLEEYSRLNALVTKHDEYAKTIKSLKQDRLAQITDLEVMIKEAEPVIHGFQQEILAVHEYVMGNRKCFFEINVSDKKQVVSYELRIFDDGSHSNEREKTFFYDMSMLLSKASEEFHPGFLVHDNIFDVDQDTLIRSLNYLAENEERLSNRQYILTLNSDKLHADEIDRLKLDIDLCRVASFTKDNRFLKRHYQEI
ncbi:uncharacterized protein YydD (DUF2326 family) [Paraburkholderia terricola]|uniref:DUF2326 domain-containing protein n=1 Tax=Paraburkholderia terricola TaxID=169427 RepID=UPI00285F498E|nr:DUF2326 domain-containing protein [Paraburkholderia terricola]MDR6493178.1 uncharacterized protein YydD (DUF2326 family) [Paraburkholderia terricola]